MVLSEGPDSGVCGKAGTEAKAYPTRTLKGLVFVWIGEGAARAHRGGRARGVLRRARPSSSSARSTGGATGRSPSRTRWTPTSTTCTATRWWSPAAASSRAARRASTRSSWATASAATWPRATTCVRTRARTSMPTAGGGRRRTYRRLWTWLTRPLAERARRHIPPPRSARWCGGHHLPGMFRAEFGWDLYTRMCVPVEEHLTRVWYYHCLRPKTALGRLGERLAYAAIHRWIIEYNFSRQDERVMINQRYDSPGEALGDRRRGDPVAPAGGDQALRRPRRPVRVQESRRPRRRTRCRSSASRCDTSRSSGG